METALDIRKLIAIGRKRMWLILLLGAIGAGGAFFAAKYLIQPVYSAKVTFYVYGQARASENTTINDINLSQKLVETYLVILKSDAVMTKVADAADLSYGVKDIREMIKASSISNTEVFEVTVLNHNPAWAQKIANSIADIAPAEIARVVKSGLTEVIDRATLPVTPISPNKTLYLIAGFLLGITLAVGISLMIELLDISIQDESDLVELYHLPVLGVIPTLDKPKGKKDAEIYEYKNRRTNKAASNI